MSEAIRVLLLPGLGNAGPDHWQSHWERARPDCRRVEQAEWEAPRRADWVAALDRAVRTAEAPVVLAGHSLACALVGHWAASAGARAHTAVHAALLVAPSDTEAPGFPPGTAGFTPMPRKELPFPSVVVYSTNDPLVSPARARTFAAWWGSRAVEAGPHGHLDSAAGVGRWAWGEALLEELLDA